MIDVNKLKARAMEMGYTMEKLAAELGINKSTLSNKLMGKYAFRKEEIEKILSVLHLSGPESILIFFPSSWAAQQIHKNVEASEQMKAVMFAK